jgi:DNA gyrase subunit A
MQIIKDELKELRERYGDNRRTEVLPTEDDITMEDMIPNEEMVITISNQGYIKRTSLSEYRTQGRGGTGSRGVITKEDDFTEHLFVAHAHNYLLIFTETGKVYWKRVYEIPEGNKASKGRAIQNLINIEPGDSVKAILNVKDLEDEDLCKQQLCDSVYRKRYHQENIVGGVLKTSFGRNQRHHHS